MDLPTDETVETFSGARAGERLHVGAQGVSLMAGNRRVWHAPHEAIRSVQAIRRVSDGMVHDTVQVCAGDGHDRHFLVATSLIDDDYDAEFSEAVADAVAESLRRAAGLG